MSVPRIARIHLVYQFIILTILIFAISYNEILPDKRFLFLALIPIFCYQLIIVFCCTELIPLPNWFSWSEAEVTSNEEQAIDKTVTPETFSTEGSKSPTESNIVSPSIPRARLSTKNKETPDSATSSDANTQTIRPNVTEIFIKKAPVFSKARRSESTKSYCISHRENKFEERLDTKDNIRSYKTRNWRSLQDQKGTKSQSNLMKSPSDLIEEANKEVKSPVKLETLEESIESDSADLSRSYSFPFRQRKQRLLEAEEKVNNFNIPVMPAWNAIDYFGHSSNSRRRKSISTEAIDRELRLINYHFEQKGKNDFTQSMEVSRESEVEPVVTKRALKPSASFNRWKQGIANCFSKTKRDNIKTDDIKPDGDKKPFFKELFLATAMQQGTEKKPVKRSNSSFPKSDNRVKLINRSPSYISYEEDYFLN